MAVDFNKVDASLFAIQKYLWEVKENNGRYMDHAEFFHEMIRRLRQTIAAEVMLEDHGDRLLKQADDVRKASVRLEQKRVKPKKKPMKRSTRIKLSKAMKKYQAKKRKANGIWKRTPQQRKNLSNAMTASHKRRAAAKKKGTKNV